MLIIHISISIIHILICWSNSGFLIFAGLLEYQTNIYLKWKEKSTNHSTSVLNPDNDYNRRMESREINFLLWGELLASCQCMLHLWYVCFKVIQYSSVLNIRKIELKTLMRLNAFILYWATVLVNVVLFFLIWLRWGMDLLNITCGCLL